MNRQELRQEVGQQEGKREVEDLSKMVVDRVDRMEKRSGKVFAQLSWSARAVGSGVAAEEVLKVTPVYDVGSWVDHEAVEMQRRRSSF